MGAGDGKRRFVAGQATQAALARAGERVKEIARQPDADPNSGVAVFDVANALKALEEGK
jgi:hypothetical protein